MVVSPWQQQDSSLECDLPEYLADSPLSPGAGGAGLHDAWDAARQLALSLLDTPGGGVVAPAQFRPASGARPSSRTASAELSGGFFRSSTLPGAALGAIVTEWSEARADQGELRVDARLRLELPRVDALGGWTARGRVRRFTRWHWVPVIVELWPSLDHWTIVMMTPRRRVVTSRRYFRIGNTALDRLTTQLAATSAGRRSGGGAHPWAAV